MTNLLGQVDWWRRWWKAWSFFRKLWLQKTSLSKSENWISRLFLSVWKGKLLYIYNKKEYKKSGKANGIESCFKDVFHVETGVSVYYLHNSNWSMKHMSGNINFRSRMLVCVNIAEVFLITIICSFKLRV